VHLPDVRTEPGLRRLHRGPHAGPGLHRPAVRHRVLQAQGREGAADMSTGIRIENLNKSFGSFQAVKDVTFEAEDGKITTLLWPSGSGKSTVLRMIAGLQQPDSGAIQLGGEEQMTKPV